MSTEYPASLDEAMALFQRDLPNITKGETAKVPGKDGKIGYTYGYAGLDSVSEIVLRRLGALGVSWRACPTLTDEGKFVLAYRLRHVSGDQEIGEWPLSGGTPQQIGSAITYARRYALMAVTGVFPADQDDDGAAASQAPRHDAWESAAPARPAAPSPRAAELFKQIDEAKTEDTLKAAWTALQEAREADQVTVPEANQLAQHIRRRKSEVTATPLVEEVPAA